MYRVYVQMWTWSVCTNVDWVYNLTKTLHATGCFEPIEYWTSLLFRLWLEIKWLTHTLTYYFQNTSLYDKFKCSTVMIWISDIWIPETSVDWPFCPDFRWYLHPGPFGDRTAFNHLNIALVRHFGITVIPN